MPISESRLFILSAIELCAAIFRGPGAADWEALTASGVPELLDRVQFFPGFPVVHLETLASGLAECAPGFEELETEYVRLFITSPGGVPAPLYASCHTEGTPQAMGDPALDMRDRLAAEGLAVALDSNEPPDHLSLELEYLYHLLAEGWSGRGPDAAGRGTEFATGVMVPWVARFREALIKAAPHPVFLAAADITLSVLAKMPDA